VSAPLHVLHVSTALRWSGAADQCLALALAMDAAGDRAPVACQPGSMLHLRARAGGLRTLPVLMRGPGDVAAARTLRGFVARYGVPVLHAHDRRARALSALASLGGRALRVATRRHVGPTPAGLLGLSRRGLTALPSRLGVDRWVAVSSRVAAGLSASGVRVQDVQVIAPGVPVDSDPARDLATRSRTLPPLGLAGHRGPLIGTLQRLDQRQALDPLIASVHQLRRRWPELRVILAGEGEQRQFIQAQVARERLSDVILVPGWVDDGPALLAALDAYVAPGCAEGDRVSLASAQAAACPLVASAVGDVPSLVEDGCTGLLVRPGDSAALTAALERLLSHPEWANGLGQAARRAARERSSLGAMVQGHRRLYAGAGERDPGARGLPSLVAP